MSASLEEKPIRFTISKLRENIIRDKREVLFLKKYHGQPGDGLIHVDYNGDIIDVIRDFNGHNDGNMGRVLITSRSTGLWLFCLW